MQGPKVSKLVVCAALVFVSWTARGDAPDGDEGPPLPSQRMQQTDPGPASALWHRGDLTPAEQVYVDHAGIVSPKANAIGAAYAAAMSEVAVRAASDAAAQQLGLDSLGSEGVVP
jgi:hypothetical protein